MAAAALAMTACSEEKIFEPSASGLPMASDYQIDVKVDDLNNIELNILDKSGAPAKGVYPIWYVNGSKRPSTQLTYRDLITIAGDYPVEMKVGNANGVSEGSLTGTIHITNTIFDFTPYMRNLTDGSSKVWHIAGDIQGHLGCGEPGTDGLGWWSAAPNDKKEQGVYDNKMTFADNGGSSSGLYTYDPGESGTIYVNTGITDLPPYSDSNTNDGADYCAPAPLQENVKFELSPEGADLFLVLPKGTLFGYLPNIELYNTPKFKINSVSKNKIELTCDNGGIAWHYILAPFEAGEPQFMGFKYDSEFNMIPGGNLRFASTWFANNDWAELSPQPEVTMTDGGFKVHTPAEMGGLQWQGQVHLTTDIVVSAGETYDFSLVVNAPVDSEITVKVQKDGDDNVFFTQDKQKFEAGGSCYYFSDVQGFDGTLKFAFDLAGYPDTDFEVSKIVFKKHSDDDGTVLPDIPDEPEEPVTWVDPNSDDNLFKGSDAFEYYYAPGWAQIDNPETVVDGNSFKLTLPEATTDQWQAQFKINTAINTSADKKYDFRVTFESNQDLPGVTYKCVKPGGGDNDNIFYMADRLAVGAYDEVTYKWVNLDGIDIENLQIVLDFGGNPAGTEVTVKDIIVQEHRD